MTAKELAKLLQLSEAAVSMALNNKPGVSTSTRQRVLDAAKCNGYDFSRLKESSEPKTELGLLSLLIYRKHGAIISDTPFFSQLTEGIEKGCRHAHYSLSIHYLYEDGNIKKQLTKLPYSSGILLLATEMKLTDFEPFHSLSAPLVVLDTWYESLSYDSILINNFQGAYQATNYLIRKTMSQAGYLRSSYPIGNFDERADGFYKAIRENGMSTSRCHVLNLTPSMDGAYQDMLELLKNGEKPARAYFADNDLIAAGTMKALKEHGYHIPNDVALIGFDDMPLCTYIEPALTTVHVPKQYMGQLAVDRLLQIMKAPQHHPVKIEIGTRIISRKSV